MSPEQEQGKDKYPGAHPNDSDPQTIGEVVEGMYGDQFDAGPLSAQDYLLKLTQRRLAGEPIDDDEMRDAIKAAGIEWRHHKDQ